MGCASRRTSTRLRACIRSRPFAPTAPPRPAKAVAALAGGGPFWLHLDVDVLDEEAFPATDYLMPGGMGWEDLGDLLTPLLASEALIGASIACYNPEKDPGGACGRALVDIVVGLRGG